MSMLQNILLIPQHPSLWWEEIGQWPGEAYDHLQVTEKPTPLQPERKRTQAVHELDERFINYTALVC